MRLLEFAPKYPDEASCIAELQELNELYAERYLLAVCCQRKFHENKKFKSLHFPFKVIFATPKERKNETSMSTLLLSSAYLAPVSYYAKLLAADAVFIEQYDHYQKQTYRNRCVIASPSGPLALSVPVAKPGNPKCYMRDIRISEHGNWRRMHWNALEAAYNNTPFFEYYKDDFRPFYEGRNYEFLMDFNEALCRLACSLIDMQPRMERTESYRPSSAPGEQDFRERIHPKMDFREVDPDFYPCPYYQVFQQELGFLPDLSIVDLLFNMGPESLLVLQECQPGRFPCPHP